MSQTPKISVIIPVYNVEPYLRECLDSVVNQTLYDIEIICVNDGSTDSSGAILAEYAAHDERIIAIIQENRGLSAARNVGIDVAKGKYIYFIDSDDYIDLDALEVLHKRAEELELEVLMFDYVRFDDETNQIMAEVKRKEYLEVYDGAVFSKMLRDDGTYWMGVWNLLIKRSFLIESEILFYEGIIHEDNLFTALLLMKARRVSHAKGTIYHWRFRRNSITTKKWSTANIYGITITIYEILKDGILHAQNACYASEVWRTIIECQEFAKDIYRNIEEKERIVDFGDEFINSFYQHCVAEPARSEEKLDSLKAKNRDQTSEVASLKLSITDAIERALTAEQSATAAWQEVDNIHRSATYRIGRIITWLPRMMRGFVRCYRENGWWHTWRRVVAHLRGR